MTEHRPILLEFFRVKGREKMLFPLWVAQFGRLAAKDHFPWPELLEIDRQLDAPTKALWRQCVAQEALLWQQSHDHAKLLFEVTAWPCLGTYIKLGEGIALRAAAALFPIHTIGPVAKIGIVWMVRHQQPLTANDEGHAIPGAHDFMATRASLRIYFFREPGDLLGNSWQLAASLAQRALGSSDATLIQKLAEKWIITGEVSGDDVREVGWGIKHTLAERPERDGHRNWLLPKANRHKAENTFLRTTFTRLYDTHTVTDALSLISKKYSRQLGDLPWPENVDTVHAFGSKAITPALVNVCWSQPRQFVLWISDNNPYAERLSFLTETIKEICTKYQLHKPEILHGTISSSNVFAAEQNLAENSSLILDKGTILFDVTGGNTLMKVALQNLARLNENLHLVYRDHDDKEQERFTLIRYESGQALTGKLIKPTTASKEINWLSLLNKNLDRDCVPADQVVSVLMKLAAEK